MADADVLLTLPRQSWFTLGEFAQWVPKGALSAAVEALQTLTARRDVELICGAQWQYRLTDAGRQRQDAARGGRRAC